MYAPLRDPKFPAAINDRCPAGDDPATIALVETHVVPTRLGIGTFGFEKCGLLKTLAAYVLTAALSLVCALSDPATAAPRHRAAPVLGPTVSAAPGTLVRWPMPGTERCGMNRRTWLALHEVCYYPIDLMEKPGFIKITRSGNGRSDSARISVARFEYATQEIDLGDIPQAKPSAEDLRRAGREESLLAKVWARKEGPARFTLPLGAPAHPLPEGRDFGSKRIFNGTPAGQPHMGADYTISQGTHVHAVADGTVALAEDQFYAGNAVYIDHGDGLISMYFHLSEIKVKAGQEVKKGDTVGQVGATGRATGAHLFFGIRWHNARINPQFLLEKPAKIPSVDPRSASATTSTRN
jgi:murein DD-endopeptidase MepM/ murein hydrolase activator NlpD